MEIHAPRMRRCGKKTKLDNGRSRLKSAPGVVVGEWVDGCMRVRGCQTSRWNRIWMRMVCKQRRVPILTKFIDLKGTKNCSIRSTFGWHDFDITWHDIDTPPNPDLLFSSISSKTKKKTDGEPNNGEKKRDSWGEKEMKGKLKPFGIWDKSWKRNEW